MTEADRGEITQVTDHVAGGLALLTGRWRDQPVIRGILTSWLEQIQILEDAAWAVHTLTIGTATYNALDQYGELLGTPDVGLSDTLYRGLLRADSLAIGSSGTCDEIRAVLYAIKPTVGAFLIREYFPASLVVEPLGALEIPTEPIHAVVRRAVSGGVRVLMIDVPEGDTFAFSDSDETVTDAARGFSNVAGLIGGQLVGVID